MRKCVRCNTEMIENLEVSITNGSYGVCIKEKGLFKSFYDFMIRCYGKSVNKKTIISLIEFKSSSLFPFFTVK